MVALADAAPPTRAAAPAWLEGRWPWLGYALAMTSMAWIDLFLWAVFCLLAGTPAAILLRLPEVGLFLIAINLAGARWLFAPVARRLRGEGSAEAALQRLSRLALWSGVWAGAVACAFAASSFLVTPFLVWGLPATPEVVALLVARALAWCVLLPYVAYFLAAEHIRRLRAALFARDGLIAPTGRVPLTLKLALVVAGGAVAPGASIAVTLALVPPVSPITGQPRELLLVVALLGAALALGVAFWAMRRSLRASLAALTEGMARVGEGARGLRVAVQSDDELGVLAARFNALSAALAESDAEGRRAADRFHEAQKQVALGRMAAGVAHDFNNILAIILGYADAVRRKGPDDPRAAARLEEIVKAADRGKALIAQILDFARARPAERARLDLTAAVAETLDWLDATVGRSVALERRLHPAPLRIEADPTGVHQVLANLCVNAAHAMRGRPGAVRVSLEALRVDGGRAAGLRARLAEDGRGEDGRGGQAIVIDDADPDRPRAFVGVLAPGRYARLAVADDGAGMTAEVLRHVFEPYFTTKPVGEGTGLGLAAVLGIVTQHEGAIVIETRPGSGTLVAVFLPLTGED